MKIILKARYYFHLFLHNHNQQLVNDAICDELKAELSERAYYHWAKATGLTAKFE
ncbi:hypothetical protein [Bacillus sp. FJAT-18017]|uniref:hypothetical protein n=1 Tax=Bacillus sp. FJAT-18017 TaxID=1705566 RepID=UPI000A56691F|nr:hypothetical protein [Bacillus sp. FJAT-18017]